MTVAVIGAGITGLTAAYGLAKRGVRVTVFEKEKELGGLVSGFRGKNWDWPLEKSYHHLFTSDSVALQLIQELGIGNRLIMKHPITANLIPLSTEKFEFAQLDTPLHLLRFPGLSILDKLRTGSLAMFCKLYPFWQTLEGTTAKEFFIRFGGPTSWRIIWKPLMTGKFGHYDAHIAASWLWARVHKRTRNLYYLEGGFETLIEALVNAIKNNGGIIYSSTEIVSIQKVSRIAYRVSWKQQKNTQYTIHNTQYDKMLLTVPTCTANRLFHNSLFNIHDSSLSIPHLHAQTLILETDEPIIKNVYWLNVTDRSFPFLAVVAHTNFMDKKHYGGHHITYIGNYLPDGHPSLTLTKKQLLEKFLPYIGRLCPSFNSTKIANAYLFTAPFAQPVHELHYSQHAPQFKTKIPTTYLANMDSIYPWDRGINYAVELGEKAASFFVIPDLIGDLFL
jgi:protoporphyrinogen oxidase